MMETQPQAQVSMCPAVYSELQLKVQKTVVHVLHQIPLPDLRGEHTAQGSLYALLSGKACTSLSPWRDWLRL